MILSTIILFGRSCMAKFRLPSVVKSFVPKVWRKNLPANCSSVVQNSRDCRVENEWRAERVRKRTANDLQFKRECTLESESEAITQSAEGQSSNSLQCKLYIPKSVQSTKKLKERSFDWMEWLTESSDRWNSPALSGEQLAAGSRQSFRKSPEPLKVVYMDIC